MQKAVRITAIALLLITAVNALVAGALFVLEPSGGRMGMSVGYLRFSPFVDYLIPGIVLLTVLGCLPLYVAFVIIRKKPFAPMAVFVQGIILIGWIAVQVLMVRDLNVLHITMAGVGMALVLCGFRLLTRQSPGQPRTRN